MKCLNCIHSDVCQIIDDPLCTGIGKSCHFLSKDAVLILPSDFLGGQMRILVSRYMIPYKQEIDEEYIKNVLAYNVAPEIRKDLVYNMTDTRLGREIEARILVVYQKARESE